jgi:transcriptional regulator with XRE-family HTH domain
MRKPVPPHGLRAVRLMKGWGIKALADAIGIEESTLWRLESGATKAPKVETRVALAKVLGVSEPMLFGK